MLLNWRGKAVGLETEKEETMGLEMEEEDTMGLETEEVKEVEKTVEETMGLAMVLHWRGKAMAARRKEEEAMQPEKQEWRE